MHSDRRRDQAVKALEPYHDELARRFGADYRQCADFEQMIDRVVQGRYAANVIADLGERDPREHRHAHDSVLGV